MAAIVAEHVGEKTVIKILHKNWSAFFFGYLYIMDLINARKIIHIKIIILYVNKISEILKTDLRRG